MAARLRVGAGGSEYRGDEWGTSLFPSKELGVYVLPVKRAVRQQEGIDIGETVTVSLQLETD